MYITSQQDPSIQIRRAQVPSLRHQHQSPEVVIRPQMGAIIIIIIIIFTRQEHQLPMEVVAVEEIWLKDGHPLVIFKIIILRRQ